MLALLSRFSGSNSRTPPILFSTGSVDLKSYCEGLAAFELWLAHIGVRHPLVESIEVLSWSFAGVSLGIQPFSRRIDDFDVDLTPVSLSVNFGEAQVNKIKAVLGTDVDSPILRHQGIPYDQQLEIFLRSRRRGKLPTKPFSVVVPKAVVRATGSLVRPAGDPWP